ncbi:MAG: hypothetical protein AAB213_03130 [Candidatus Omnitrophota bacterium]
MFKQSFFVAVVVAIFTIQPAFAQPAGQGMPGMQQRQQMTPEEMAKKDEERINRRLEEMTKNLGLTPQQQAQIREILTQTSAEIRKLMQEAHASVQGFMEKDRAAIKALLTEEQKKILEEKRPKPGQGQVPPPQSAEGK